MSKQQNCPWCNAKIFSTLDSYTCDSYFDEDDGELIQSADCIEAEYIYKKVLEEREACIEIAKQYALKYSPEMCLIKDVCDAIRARGEVK